MSNSTGRQGKSPSPAPTNFGPDLTELAAQVAEEENSIPTTEEVLRRGHNWQNVSNVYGGDNLQLHIDIIKQFDHRRIDAVAVAAKVRANSRFSYLVPSLHSLLTPELPLLLLTALQNPGYARSFLTVLSIVQQRETRKYILALLDRLLQGSLHP